MIIETKSLSFHNYKDVAIGNLTFGLIYEDLRETATLAGSGLSTAAMTEKLFHTVVDIVLIAPNAYIVIQCNGFIIAMRANEMSAGRSITAVLSSTFESTVQLQSSSIPRYLSRGFADHTLDKLPVSAPARTKVKVKGVTRKEGVTGS